LVVDLVAAFIGTAIAAAVGVAAIPGIDWLGWPPAVSPLASGLYARAGRAKLTS